MAIMISSKIWLLDYTPTGCCIRRRYISQTSTKASSVWQNEQKKPKIMKFDILTLSLEWPLLTRIKCHLKRYHLFMRFLYRQKINDNDTNSFHLKWNNSFAVNFIRLRAKRCFCKMRTFRIFMTRFDSFDSIQKHFHGGFLIFHWT